MHVERVGVAHVRAATLVTRGGWRKSELLNLRWNQVDLEAGTVSLAAGTTKNSKARLVVFDSFPELKEMFEKQPRVVAKKITGHLTDSMYERYNIVSEADMREAGAKIAARQLG